MTRAGYRVDIEAPDISVYRAGNTAVDYVTTLDSGRSGAHIMLSAIVHGNELCGAIALDFLHRQQVRPTQGKLTLAFMNVAAFERFDPEDPATSRYVDEDFNRVWSAEVLDGSRNSAELERARAVRPILDDVDFLLDIHSMQNPTTPLMMCGPLEKGLELARQIGAPAHVVCDSGHAGGRRMRDYAAFADPDSARNALLIECGQHWELSSVEVAKDAALRFLAHFRAVDLDFVQQHLSAVPPPAQHVIEVTEAVTIATNRFRFAEPYQGMEVIESAGTVIGWDGDDEIRTPYERCVLIMPSRRLRKGESAVRFGRYVT